MKKTFLASALVVMFVGCSGSGDEQASRSTDQGIDSQPSTSQTVDNNRTPRSAAGEPAGKKDNRSSSNTRDSQINRGQPSNRPSARPPTSESNVSRRGSPKRDRDVRTPNDREPGPPTDPRSKPTLALPAFPGVSGKSGTEVGDLIPEISGKDIEGVKFQLSDYNGKVVMIDFWGDW